ncbi:hypothetical protein [Deinococcus arcticus]|uniref:Uncharacterized protein n=1 Tax=Deinococcus arcticus TaxID=2136176 RepID=A0A2T3W4B4_9DEIO|nr:hypothetical protein [Deinococcus arcticus]PTA66603.1 hypothetical protein C8263_17020 [Deinococcus arcticus]
MSITLDALKAEAHALTAAAKARQESLAHKTALNTVARRNGYANYEAARHHLKVTRPTRPDHPPLNPTYFDLITVRRPPGASPPPTLEHLYLPYTVGLARQLATLRDTPEWRDGLAAGTVVPQPREADYTYLDHRQGLIGEWLLAVARSSDPSWHHVYHLTRLSPQALHTHLAALLDFETRFTPMRAGFDGIPGEIAVQRAQRELAQLFQAPSRDPRVTVAPLLALCTLALTPEALQRATDSLIRGGLGRLDARTAGVRWQPREGLMREDRLQTFEEASRAYMLTTGNPHSDPLTNDDQYVRSLWDQAAAALTGQDPQQVLLRVGHDLLNGALPGEPDVEAMAGPLLAGMTRHFFSGRPSPEPWGDLRTLTWTGQDTVHSVQDRVMFPISGAQAVRNQWQNFRYRAQTRAAWAWLPAAVTAWPTWAPSDQAAQHIDRIRPGLP